MIRIKNLNKSFNGNHVLRGVNLEIIDGEIFVIIGRSGSGKSVLLKHCIGLFKPNSGEVLIDQDDMTALTGPKLYEKLKSTSMVFQMCALFDSMTVGENIGFYLREHLLRGGKKIKPSDINGFVEEALEKVGLGGTANLSPSSLSGGMKKRASIARSIISKPNYIFYDEPTTGLDPETSLTIAKLIVDQHNELKGTTIVISHDIITTLYVADRIALIENGVIQFVDKPNAFLDHDHPTINLIRKSIGNDRSLIRNKG